MATVSRDKPRNIAGFALMSKREIAVCSEKHGASEAIVLTLEGEDVLRPLLREKQITTAMLYNQISIQDGSIMNKIQIKRRY